MSSPEPTFGTNANPNGLRSIVCMLEIYFGRSRKNITTPAG